MTEAEFRELLARGHEIQGVEFKSPGSRKNKRLLAQVVRAALGMANRRYGGKIIIGVKEDSNNTPVPIGLSCSDLATWTYDDLSSSISSYADPSVSFESNAFEYEGKQFLIIEVEEFNDIPVICKRSYDDVLRDGACYVRPRRKPETSEIPSQADMRDLLDLATEKRLRKFLSTAQSVRVVDDSSPGVTDEHRFEEEITEFFGDSGVKSIIETIHSRGYWQVAIRPDEFVQDRVADILSLFPILQKSCVEMRGWDFPHIGYKLRPHIDLTWISEQIEWEHYLEVWRFHKSGLFLHLGGMPIDWRDRSNLWPAYDKWLPGQLLGVGDTLYRFTEIFEFASRLALTEAGGDQMHIEIRIGNLKDRSLYIGDRRGGEFFRNYTTSLEEFPYEDRFNKSQLVSSTRDLAIDASHELFKRFNWHVTRDELDQLHDDLLRK